MTPNKATFYNTLISECLKSPVTDMEYTFLTSIKKQIAENNFISDNQETLLYTMWRKFKYEAKNDYHFP